MSSAEERHEWYLQHRDGHAAQGKLRYQKHKKEISVIGKNRYQEDKVYKAARNLVWRRANPSQRLLTAARARAKRLSLPFDLCLADIQIPEFCPVLGLKLTVAVPGQKASSPSLDRIIPAAGYVRGNVIVVSWRANSIKKDATAEELRKLADFYQALIR